MVGLIESSRQSCDQCLAACFFTFTFAFLAFAFANMCLSWETAGHPCIVPGPAFLRTERQEKGMT